jgi:hypothetical protein
MRVLVTSFTGKKPDRATVEEALRIVNGNAQAHTITTFERVWEIAERAERHLDALDIRKNLRTGAVASYIPAGPAAAAYRYPVIATKIVMERTASAWFLVDVVREKAYPKQSSRFSLSVSDEAAICSVEHSLAWVGRTLDDFDRARRRVLATRARA